MKPSKMPLTMMEQVIMIGLFALAAAVCLQVFVYTGQGSKALAREEDMLSLARTVAEIYQADDRTAADRLGLEWTVGGEILSQTVDGYMVCVTEAPRSGFYQEATVEITDESGQSVCLTVSRQTGA